MVLQPEFLQSIEKGAPFYKELARKWAESAEEETQYEMQGLRDELGDLEEKLASQRPVFPLTLHDVEVLKLQKQARLKEVLESRVHIEAALEALKG
jgi:hypothetical protein